jgi:hypothetical protein
MPETTTAPTPAPSAETALTAELRELLERASAGDSSTLPALAEALDRRPQLWQLGGDLGWHAEQACLALFAGQDLFAREAVRRRLASLKAELAGGPVTPLERLVIDRIGVSWLQVHLADRDAAEARRRDGGATALSVHAQRRLDSAHRRYLMAVKQLALVRRLLPRPGGRGAGAGRRGKAARGAAGLAQGECQTQATEAAG